ncbi:MAG: hypothetical protein Unbinned97contig1000_31 [Prokaryotic dsDNA virus sp.]|nr:MAG: hypothetical protein Unbinned97contig1000_31 [Prokaryotic dsDNA virus sp.]|tara:strand:- start:1736 stop:2044 length:309 start_codon:yes stop_codon:yes gene_type:complete
MNTNTNKLKVTSAIYTNKDGINILIELDPKKKKPLITSFEQYQATFAGLKVIDNQTSMEKLIENLEKESHKYKEEVENLMKHGYVYNSPLSEELRTKHWRQL